VFIDRPHRRNDVVDKMQRCLRVCKTWFQIDLNFFLSIFLETFVGALRVNLR
jgi:hypothetical protein